MGLFDLLAQFLQFFVDLIPVPAARPWSNSYCVVDSYLIGVHRVKRPFIYLPILDDVCYIPKHEQTLTTDVQTITTADEHTVTVESEFTYKIVDPILLREMAGSEDYDARLTMMVRGEVETLYREHNFSHVLEMGNESLIENLSWKLEEYGIEVVDIATQDRSISRALRHYGVSITHGG